VVAAGGGEGTVKALVGVDEVRAARDLARAYREALRTQAAR